MILPGDLIVMRKMKSNGSSPASSTPSIKSKGSPLNSISQHSKDIHKRGSGLREREGRRCAQCGKKMSICCRYECRCGRTFCASHRYAETHNCTFDYKQEGRKLLQKDNPLVVSKKVDKI